jgi:hypothetical protein
MSINLIRKVSNDLTKNRQYNLKNIWSIKHNTCSYIQSNSNQLKTGGQFRYDMSLRKTNIFKHIMITVEFVFAISHNFKYCHWWTIITFLIINVWTVFSLLTGESLIPKLALTVIVVLFMLFGILPRFFCVKLIFVSSMQGGWAISSRMYLLLALPHLWRVLRPYPKVLCHKGII